MAITDGSSSTAPLLDGLPPNSHRRIAGGATWTQTLGNIVVSIVGTGVLGLPYAFRMAGWLAGTVGVAVAGASTFFCMLLLIQCRDRLEEHEDEEINDEVHIQSYGDLGAKVFGTTGRYLTELLVLTSQAGSAVAYLVFIGQNLSSLFTKANQSLVSPTVFIFFLLLPLEIILSFIRSLSSIAPFSAFADACNVLAMAIVIKEEIQMFNRFSWERSAFNGTWGLPFAGGVAVFCFDGFSMTLPLEASMADRRKFRWVLLVAFMAITTVYISFGIFGYLAYGDETKDIITLNLPNDWSAIAVKVGLCIALAFTFPIILHPIYEIIEMKLASSGWSQKLCCNAHGERLGLHGARMLVLLIITTVASCIPGFGAFISLVGSTVSAMLAFVLPATFHLLLLGSKLKLWQRAVDYLILIVGIAFAGYGTYDALSHHLMGS
ncbi:amino acid transporter ANT1-like [Dendrobium catenatum]|uniref:Lysine histidine transporter-like 3 n=1 Tax=Dendrobium catenatum TaxID=906689 RepID=A0A2I0X0X6_9ASPA|nr:amino acid transporter ANT1-like [Dendrobium catenatum]PKU81566.1 Lysine histidine transporter-like 3 [Dendrobium catenatum]